MKRVFFLFFLLPTFCLADTLLYKKDGSAEISLKQKKYSYSFTIKDQQKPVISSILIKNNPNRLIVSLDNFNFTKQIDREFQEQSIKALKIQTNPKAVVVEFIFPENRLIPYDIKSYGNGLEILLSLVKPKVKKALKKEVNETQAQDLNQIPKITHLPIPAEKPETEIIEHEVEEQSVQLVEETPIVAEPQIEEHPVIIEPQQVLNKIEFLQDLNNEYYLLLSFSNKANFKLSKQGTNSFLMSIQDFSIEDEKLLLPYYAPSNFQGLVSFKAKNNQTEDSNQEIQLQLIAEENYNLKAVVVENKIEVRVQQAS